MGKFWFSTQNRPPHVIKNVKIKNRAQTIPLECLNLLRLKKSLSHYTNWRKNITFSIFFKIQKAQYLTYIAYIRIFGGYTHFKARFVCENVIFDNFLYNQPKSTYMKYNFKQKYFFWFSLTWGHRSTPPYRLNWNKQFNFRFRKRHHLRKKSQIYCFFWDY